jgi:hypothetical protein
MARCCAVLLTLFDVACLAAACIVLLLYIANRQLDLWAACKRIEANIGGHSRVLMNGVQLLRFERRAAAEV